MNLHDDPTRDDFRALLAACDDARGDHLIWVSNGGAVHISCLAEDETPMQWTAIKFRYEPLARGAGKVGPAAARDETWVRRLWDEAILRDWQSDACGLMDLPGREVRGE